MEKISLNEGRRLAAAHSRSFKLKNRPHSATLATYGRKIPRALQGLTIFQLQWKNDHERWLKRFKFYKKIKKNHWRKKNPKQIDEFNFQQCNCTKTEPKLYTICNPIASSAPSQWKGRPFWGANEKQTEPKTANHFIHEWVGKMQRGAWTETLQLSLWTVFLFLFVCLFCFWLIEVYPTQHGGSIKTCPVQRSFKITYFKKKRKKRNTCVK